MYQGNFFYIRGHIINFDHISRWFLRICERVRENLRNI